MFFKKALKWAFCSKTDNFGTGCGYQPKKSLHKTEGIPPVRPSGLPDLSDDEIPPMPEDSPKRRYLYSDGRRGDATNKQKTDLDRFIDLYRSFGIECKVINWGAEKAIQLSDHRFTTGKSNLFHDQKNITPSDKFNGLTIIYFDTSGKFIKQGFWE